MAVESYTTASVRRRQLAEVQRHVGALCHLSQQTGAPLASTQRPLPGEAAPRGGAGGPRLRAVVVAGDLNVPVGNNNRMSMQGRGM